MADKVILIKDSANNYYPQTLATSVYRPNKSTSIETTLAKLETDIKKVVDKYNESYPLPVGFIDNAWSIWDGQSGVAYLNNGQDHKRFCTPTFFYIDRPTTISFSGGDTYQYCTLVADNASGANAKWGKTYASGNSYVLAKGFHAIVLKKLSGSEEQVINEYDFKNFKFTLTPTAL